MRQAFQALRALYDLTVTGLAVVARLLIVAVFVMIIFDVVSRTAGWGSPIWTVSLTEYGLLFATVFGSPWLIRRKGHVFISVFTSRVPNGGRRRIEALSMAISAIVCVILAYYATILLLDLIDRGMLDIRSFGTPAWVVIAPIPICFLLMAGEFLRFLFGRDSMYEADPQSAGGGL